MKKNLRKLLVLVLTVAMVLSISAIAASAASFTDTTKTTYGEAIAVLSGIGVINGTTSTTFDPTGSLTRESAAKIITYMMLGATNADLIKNASSQKFSDVAPDRWSAGYIEYCANQGIVGGSGDGKFNPTGTLTTAAFTKMLLCALGYKADVEQLTGSSWANNTASLAVVAGVYDSSISISAITTCTREQAAQLAFKALTAKTVTYSGGSTISIGGTTIVTGATRSYVVGSTDNNANYDNAKGDGYAQFCETYFSLLKLNTSFPDAFGRPAHKWTNNVTSLGVFADTPVATYTASKVGFESTVASDLSGYTLPVDGGGYKNVENYTTYTTGGGGTKFDSGAIVNKNAAGASKLSVAGLVNQTIAGAIAGETANGKVVQIFANTSKQITAIIEITCKVGTVSNVTTSTTGTTYALSTPAGVADGSYTNYTDDKLFVDTISTTAALKQGDVVTYVVVGGTAYVYPTTMVTGIPTSIGSIYGTQSVTVGGTTYTAAAGVTNHSTFGTSSVAANYYLDQYGYAVLSTATAASTNYVYLLGEYGKFATDVNGTVPTAQVKAVKADGTIAVYNLSLTKLTASSSQIGTTAANNPGVLKSTKISDSSVLTIFPTLAAGDYVVTGTNVLVYDAAAPAADATYTYALTGTQDDTSANTAVSTALTTACGYVFGYTLDTAGTTITLQPKDIPGAGVLTVGNVYYTPTTGATLGYGVTSAACPNSKTALVNSATVYVVYYTDLGTAAVYTSSTGLPSNATGLTGYMVMTANTGAAGTASYVFAQHTAFSSVVTTNYVYINSSIFSTALGTGGATVYTYTGTKADGTTIQLTDSTDATGLSTSGVYTYNADNTVSNGIKKAGDTSTDTAAHNTNGIIYDASLSVVGSLLSVTNTQTSAEVYYNITSDTKVVYINPTLNAVDGNGGYVVRATVNGALTTNVATIYITVD